MRHEAGATPFPNRLTRRGGATVDEYAYDANGSLLRDPEIGTLHYDLRQRLVRVERPDGTVIRPPTTTTTIDGCSPRSSGRASPCARGSRSKGFSSSKTAARREWCSTKGAGSPSFRRLAIRCIHHFDRLGNVNVISNGITGAYAGSDEYTPVRAAVHLDGRSSRRSRSRAGVSPTAWKSRCSARGGIALRSAVSSPAIRRSCRIRIGSHRLARRSTCMCMRYCNPTNFTDATGEIAPLLVAIIVAAIVGAVHRRDWCGGERRQDVGRVAACGSLAAPSARCCRCSAGTGSSCGLAPRW